MEQARQGANLLGAYFDGVDVALKRAEDSLKTHFERCYCEREPTSESSERYNPVKLLERLKNLEVELPELKRRTLATFDTASWLPNSIVEEATAASCALLATTVQPDDDVAALREETETTGMALEEALAKHEEALKEFGVRTEVIRERGLLNEEKIPDAPPLDFEKNRVPQEADIDAENAKQQKSPPPSAESDAPRATKKRSLMRKTSARTRKAAPAAPPKGNSGADGADGFKAIEKSAFNRLPRNKKFGKLPELNEFYEKIHAVLVQEGDPMPEEELLAAAGETKGDKLKSLWGLSILRQSDKGWYLATKKR